jgi:hypothetical protein
MVRLQSMLFTNNPSPTDDIIQIVFVSRKSRTLKAKGVSKNSPKSILQKPVN